jgi:hypothetical protein
MVYRQSFVKSPLGGPKKIKKGFFIFLSLCGERQWVGEIKEKEV